MSEYLIAGVVGYLVGSIPFGLLIGLARGVDLRKHGSGNIGATNAMRVLGRRLGGVCFALDVLKGVLPVVFAGWLTGHLGREPGAASAGETLAFLAVAAMPMLGHIFPVWLKFKGGKGVATGLGVMLGVYPVLTAAVGVAVAVWVCSAAALRMVGISSVLAAVSMPAAVGAYALLRGGEGAWAYWPYVAVTGLLAALVVWTHRGNIARTLAGTEPRIGERRRDGAPPR